MLTRSSHHMLMLTRSSHHSHAICPAVFCKAPQSFAILARPQAEATQGVSFCSGGCVFSRENRPTNRPTSQPASQPSKQAAHLGFRGGCELDTLRASTVSHADRTAQHKGHVRAPTLNALFAHVLHLPTQTSDSCAGPCKPFRETIILPRLTLGEPVMLTLL